MSLIQNTISNIIYFITASAIFTGTNIIDFFCFYYSSEKNCNLSVIFIHCTITFHHLSAVETE